MASGNQLEVFRHSLQSVVEEMGVTLERTAYSTNIKIRRDYSCAIFDSRVRHIAQYTAAPAQIAAILYSVPNVVEQHEERLEAGDALIVNDPASGGSVHLPDVMMITPIFDGDDIVGYAANDAHHVDIGGSTPGGIPTDSTDLYSEGLILPGVKAATNWEFDEDVMNLILRNVRNREERKGDYQAQLGANRIGSERFVDIITEYDEEFEPLVDELLAYTERRIRSNIEALPDGVYEADTYLDGDGISDDPIRLAVAVTVDGDEVEFDFTGSGDQNAGPVNSNPSTTFAACIMAILSIIGKDLPVNEGLYEPFELVTPDGSMLNPEPNAPIAGTGEIDIRICDLIVKCLSNAVPEKAIAATKGTICNVSYGGSDPRDDSEYVHYETYGGGYGARPTKDGMDAVQPYLQNTANSPIEELEKEIPLVVRKYELREDSEGAGKFRGGLGLRRDLEFYDHAASFTVLADRSKFAPWGLFGGEEGAMARYLVNPDTDSESVLNSKSSVVLEPGDVASIQTPGGGGYGDPADRDVERVLRDVREEKISPERARETYGVDVSEQTLEDE